MVIAFVWTQLILIPILGGIWMGIRKEKESYKKLVKLACIAASRRRR